MGIEDIDIQRVLVAFPPLLIALVFHEYAHAIVATYFGDTTAKEQGRLTLNPIAHADLFGTVIFPIAAILMKFPILFGWANPVPISPTRFKNYRRGLFLVSLAGPFMNLFLAVLSTVILACVVSYLSPEFIFFKPLVLMTFSSIGLNIILCLFNLIPMHPLDGGKIASAVLPYRAAQVFERISEYGSIILILLLMSGAFGFFFELSKIGTNILLNLIGPLFGAADQLGSLRY